MHLPGTKGAIPTALLCIVNLAVALIQESYSSFISSRIFSCQVEACLDYLYPFITFSSYFSVTTSDILEFEWNIIFHIPWISLLQTNIPASSFLFNASINLIDEVLIFYGYICVFLGNSLDTSSSAPSPLSIDANLDLMLS